MLTLLSLKKADSTQKTTRTILSNSRSSRCAFISLFLSVSLPLSLSVSVKLVFVCKCSGVCRGLPMARCDECVLCCFPACRAGPGVHRVPQSRLDAALGTTLGSTLLLNASDAGVGQSGESDFGQLLGLIIIHSSQFLV